VPHGYEVIKDFPLGRQRLDKIGSGEGAQAYGYGLYEAGNEGVAKSYRDTLGDYTNSVKWKGEQPPTPQQQSILNKLGGADARSGKAMTVDMMIRDAEHGMFPNEKRAAQYRADYQELERIAPLIETTPPGRMYEVRINADPQDFLDWDKPYTSNPKAVAFANQYGIAPHADTGAALHGAADMKFAGYPASAAGREKLLNTIREAGIPGIRYLDQGSRTAGEGSSNYVVFDDALIDILKKYSNGSPLGSGVGMTNALMPYQDQSQDPTTSDILKRYGF
jgi:hypothetical protein